MNDPFALSTDKRRAARPAAEREGDALLTRRTSLRFLIGLAVGVLGSLFAFYITLFMLLKTDNLPPPAFANSLCIDDKLRFMRENPSLSPDLLIIGSSVAWRHVDGAVVAKVSGGLKPLNAGFCGLHANQSVYVANWLLDQHPSIRQVVLIASPQDFGRCRKEPDAVFDLEDASDFVYGGASRWPYYIHYFSPTSLLRNARGIKDKRSNANEFDPLVFTQFGDGPLNTMGFRGLLYGVPDPLDASCFASLHSLATRLHQDKRKLMVVTTPIHPEWKSRYDPDGRLLADFASGLRTAVAPAGGKLWNASVEWNPDPKAFTDAIHLRWTAARAFSAALGQRLPS